MGRGGLTGQTKADQSVCNWLQHLHEVKSEFSDAETLLQSRGKCSRTIRRTVMGHNYAKVALDALSYS